MQNADFQNRRSDIFPSKAVSDSLKSIFAICVLVHHIYQEITIFSNTFLDVHFRLLGYLSVSVFFFLTGYGLMLSFGSKGDTYIHAFPRNRIFPFYIKILLLVAVYALLKLLLNGSLDVSALLSSMLLGGSIIRNGWYIQVTLYIYLLYFIVFKLTKRTCVGLFLITAGMIVYTIVCIKIRNTGIWWYESNLAFVAGLLYAALHKKIQKINFSKHILAVFLSLGVFAVSYALIVRNELNSTVYLIIKAISSISFPLTVVLLATLLPLHCHFLTLLSKISFEIYVSQGLFLTLFHSNSIYIDNPYIYALTVTLSTVLFSIVLHFVFIAADKMIKST